MVFWILTSLFVLLVLYAVLLGVMFASKQADAEERDWHPSVRREPAGHSPQRGDRRVREGTAKDRQNPQPF